MAFAKRRAPFYPASDTEDDDQDTDNSHDTDDDQNTDDSSDTEDESDEENTTDALEQVSVPITIPACLPTIKH